MDARLLLIRLNNWIAFRRLARLAPADLLLLVPHCLQNSACECRVLADPDRCERCGRCDLKDLLRIRDTYGVAFRLVAGGRAAIGAVQEGAVKGVVAIACEKELVAGIFAAFPKPVWGLPNRRPNGPCRDTRAPFDEVENFLQQKLVKPLSKRMVTPRAPCVRGCECVSV